MAIVVPNAFALTLAATGSGKLSIVLWENLALAYAADEEATGYPVSNLANPSTVEGWRGTTTGAQVVTATLDPTVAIDGIGVERHNLGSTGAEVAIEAVAAGDDPEDPGDWSAIVAGTVPAGDDTLMYRFAPDYYEAVRLAVTPGSAAPRAAVMSVGRYLVMEKGVQPHTPIGWGIRRTVQTSRSQSGDFLGRVITDSTRQARAAFKTLTPGWVRSSGWLRFAAAAASEPFFFAWNPEDYPAEVGFCWALNDLVAETAHLAGFADISIEMEGVVA